MFTPGPGFSLHETERSTHHAHLVINAHFSIIWDQYCRDIGFGIWSVGKMSVLAAGFGIVRVNEPWRCDRSHSIPIETFNVIAHFLQAPMFVFPQKATKTLKTKLRKPRLYLVFG